MSALVFANVTIWSDASGDTGTDRLRPHGQEPTPIYDVRPYPRGNSVQMVRVGLNPGFQTIAATYAVNSTEYAALMTSIHNLRGLTGTVTFPVGNGTRSIAHCKLISFPFFREFPVEDESGNVKHIVGIYYQWIRTRE